MEEILDAPLALPGGASLQVRAESPLAATAAVGAALAGAKEKAAKKRG